jgi:hypothetical protein
MPEKLTNLDTLYETLSGDCPHTGRRAVFNRREDLETFEPIGGEEHKCAECGQPVWITGDEISPPYKYMRSEGYLALNVKKYSLAVIHAVQALEFFMLTCLVAELTRPIDPRDYRERDALAAEIVEATEHYTFGRLRDLVLQLFLARPFPDEASSRTFIATFRSLRTPPRTQIEAIGDQPLSEALLRLFDYRAHEVRNKAAHRLLYRATRAEAEAALKDAELVWIFIKKAASAGAKEAYGGI